jgi:divinyl protochlorophyllide a 8-vinyl-reductase
VNAIQGRIGPNAITRVAEVLPRHVGASGTRALFARAGLAGYLAAPPEAMVDEREVRALHDALRDALGPARAADVAAEAGRRTADYLLARRIPKLVQALLRLLPAPLAARVLARAIAGHAWTFVGSGRFDLIWPGGRGGAARLVFTIHDNPLCRGLSWPAPACDFHAAVFVRLFRALVHRRARAVEVACEARGDPACAFELHW